MSHVIAFLLGYHIATQSQPYEQEVVNTNISPLMSADDIGFAFYILTLVMTPILFLLIVFSDDKHY